MKEIWFIRHAESEGNAGIRTANTQDNPLTQKGLKQAEALTTHLYFSDEPDLIIHSKYKRTIQTMQPFVDGLPHNGTPHIPIKEWPVHEYTYLCGKKYANSTEPERRPAKKIYWGKMDPDYVDGSDAESFSSFARRAHSTIKKLSGHPAKLIYVYTHGWFIKMVTWILLNEPFYDRLEWNSETMASVFKYWKAMPFPNTGILKVKIDNQGTWLNTWVPK
ncbi:hypothetical protein LCGC14_0914480 [marine sediment metagenome]|uniref:Phosphoglycerate mutase family protein n=1 Tax=marine sediment metagenome TaxID=412755 RepID=A0A0F9NSK0_9ZZZZ